MSGNAQIDLVMDWPPLIAGDQEKPKALRRDSTGFGDIQELALRANTENPLQINAFFYAFLCPAKNFDLFLVENTDAIKRPIEEIKTKLEKLEEFERDGSEIGNAQLKQLYLATRYIAARANARDEQRTMATLLFNGPSHQDQIAAELGISPNLAGRTCLALKPVVTMSDVGMFALNTDTNTLAVVIYLVRSTLGLDPIGVLNRRIRATAEGARP